MASIVALVDHGSDVNGPCSLPSLASCWYRVCLPPHPAVGRAFHLDGLPRLMP